MTEKPRYIDQIKHRSMEQHRWMQTVVLKENYKCVSTNMQHITIFARNHKKENYSNFRKDSKDSEFVRRQNNEKLKKLPAVRRSERTVARCRFINRFHTNNLRIGLTNNSGIYWGGVQCSFNCKWVARFFTERQLQRRRWKSGGDSRTKNRRTKTWIVSDRTRILHWWRLEAKCVFATLLFKYAAEKWRGGSGTSCHVAKLNHHEMNHYI